MDAFIQGRVLELRKEIAALRYDNESYQQKTSHTDSEFKTNELRKVRLLAIKEELVRLSERQLRRQ